MAKYDLQTKTQSVIVDGQQKTVRSGFNFEAYNSLMDSANSGLRLYLAIQQLEQVEQVMRRFNSPFSSDIIALVDAAKKLRDDNKKYLASRQANTESLKKDNTTSGDLDNLEHLKHATNSGDYAKETA